jgi:hypothetical protein
MEIFNLGTDYGCRQIGCVWDQLYHLRQEVKFNTISIPDSWLSNRSIGFIHDSEFIDARVEGDGEAFALEAIQNEKSRPVSQLHF